MTRIPRIAALIAFTLVLTLVPAASALPVEPVTPPCDASPCVRPPQVELERRIPFARCEARMCVFVTVYMGIDTSPTSGEPMMAMAATYSAPMCPPAPPSACEDTIGASATEPPQCGAGCEPGDIQRWVLRTLRSIDGPAILQTEVLPPR